MSILQKIVEELVEFSLTGDIFDSLESLEKDL